MPAIRTRYYGPSNSRGSRIGAKCEARTLYIPYRHELDLEDNHKAAAEALIRALGWYKINGARYEDMVGGHFDGDRYWVFLSDERTKVRAH